MTKKKPLRKHHQVPESKRAVLCNRGGTLLDHIPLPKRSVHMLDEVPFVCGDSEYDGGSFDSYPERMQWAVFELMDHTTSKRNAIEKASFFQTSLFFGFLTDILRTQVHVADFVTRSSSGKPVLTTKNLPEYLKKWIIRELFLTQSARQKRINQIESTLTSYRSLFSEWEAVPIDETSCRYYCLLARYVQLLYPLVYWGTGDEQPVLMAMKDSPWPRAMFAAVRHRMLANGWCPSDIKRIHSSNGELGVYYASLLQTRHVEAMASPALPISHDNCTSNTCHAYQIDEESYKTLHTSSTCHCDFLGPDMAAIIGLIALNKIPVLYWDGALKVDFVRAGTNYVAISHVWSHGLGNPSGNELPRCQVLQLIKNLSRFNKSDSQQPVRFWIDTLCCPINHRRARTLAIRSMGKVYGCAQSVLVIDNYVKSHMLSEISTQEAFAVIACSQWNRRLWTLQEGLMAGKSLLFMFADTFLSVSSRMDCHWQLATAEAKENFHQWGTRDWEMIEYALQTHAWLTFIPCFRPNSSLLVPQVFAHTARFES